MATKKQSTENWLVATQRRFEQRKIDNPVIDERWFVVDYYPSIAVHGDEYETRWSAPRTVRCSDYFPSKEHAEKFIEEHDPEPGAQLRIHHQNKRRMTTEEWVNW